MVDVEKGQAALHKAAAYKRRTICCMLVAAGASLLIKVRGRPHQTLVQERFHATFLPKLVQNYHSSYQSSSKKKVSNRRREGFSFNPLNRVMGTTRD